MKSLRKRLKLTWYRYILLRTHKHSAGDKTDLTPQSVALLPWGCLQISEYTGFGVGGSEKGLWPHCPRSRVFLKTGRNIRTVDPKSILRIHCLDVSLGCWGPWHPAGNSTLHSDPHPSLESHGDPVKHKALTSIVCTLISFSTSQSHQKQNLKSVLSLSLPPSFLPLPPWYVCVYIYVSMYVVFIHIFCFPTHAHRMKEDVACPFLFFFLLL